MTIATKREGRLILLGIDSLDLPLTQHFAESGAMPNFASLLGNSPIVSLSEESTKPLPSAVWETLMTGVSPAVHGFIDGVKEAVEEETKEKMIATGKLIDDAEDIAPQSEASDPK